MRPIINSRTISSRILNSKIINSRITNSRITNSRHLTWIFILLFVVLNFVYAENEVKIKKARELLKKANETYEIGDYDTSAKYAEEAKRLAMEIEEAKRAETLKLKAMQRIDDAKVFLKKAGDFGAETYAPSEFKEAKSLLGEAESLYSGKDYENSLKKAEESIKKSKECLKVAAQEKKRLGKEKTYKVRLIRERRDCLWRIAEYDFIYNDPFKWPVIWKSNKDKILDPDLIFPGQVFSIPALVEEIKVEIKTNE